MEYLDTSSRNSACARALPWGVSSSARDRTFGPSVSTRHILLVDPKSPAREVLAERLRMQGYSVSIASDGAEGAHAALSEPPDAVVADLWMPSISGVQLCRLLKAEPSTANVPVLLRGAEGRRNQFWAERAGASAYVVQGRMGDLVRALGRTILPRSAEAAVPSAAPEGTGEVRDRIAAHLDEALFESVLAAEVRQLAVTGSFDRLFDLFAQFVSQVTSYRWLALSTLSPPRLGVHTNPAAREQAVREANAAMLPADGTHLLCVEDDDAFADENGPPPIVLPVLFGSTHLGNIAIAARAPSHPRDRALVEVLARELGGAVRVATLVEETQRLATVDALTGLRNRRAFIEAVLREVARTERYGDPLTVMLLDIDHFKRVNDTFGHASGDLVLSAVGHALAESARTTDVAARWGGEEFVVALTATTIDGARIAAERMRSAIEALKVRNPEGVLVPVTASFGVASCRRGDSLESLVDRADRAMYMAKTSGRNRVVLERAAEEAVPAVLRAEPTEAKAAPPAAEPAEAITHH